MSTDPWYTWYMKCWEAIYEKIAALAEFADADIIYGYKSTIETYPTVYVCPGNIDITPASLNMYDNKAVIDIGVATQQSGDPKEGYQAVLQLVGVIYDAVVDDKKLNYGGENLVDQLEPSRIEPNWRGLGVRGEEDFWCGFTVTLTRYRL